MRLQCYEGLDVASAVYEWNYAQLMLEVRLAEASGERARAAIEQRIFGEKFLTKRPILQAIEADRRPAAGAAHRRDRPNRRALSPSAANYCVEIPALRPRRTNFWTLPVAVFGSSVTK